MAKKRRLGSVLGAKRTPTWPAASAADLDVGLRRRGPGPPPLPPVEVNSEGPKDPRTPSTRAVAGPAGPRPDLKAYASAADPFFA